MIPNCPFESNLFKINLVFLWFRVLSAKLRWNSLIFWSQNPICFSAFGFWTTWPVSMSPSSCNICNCFFLGCSLYLQITSAPEKIRIEDRSEWTYKIQDSHKIAGFSVSINIVTPKRDVAESNYFFAKITHIWHNGLLTHSTCWLTNYRPSFLKLEEEYWDSKGFFKLTQVCSWLVLFWTLNFNSCIVYNVLVIRNCW